MRIKLSKSQWEQIGKTAGWRLDEDRPMPLSDIVDDAKFISGSIDTLWQSHTTGMFKDYSMVKASVEGIIQTCDSLKNKLVELMKKYEMN